MHVLQLVSGGKTANGALLYALGLAHALADRGIRVTVATPPAGYVAQHLDLRRVDLISTDLHRWPTDELRRVHGEAVRRGVDVFHSHCSRAHAFGVLLRRLYGGRCVATAHSTSRQLHWCANDFVIACSEATRRYQIRANLVLPWRIRTIHYPIDLARFRPLASDQVVAVRRRLGLDPRRPVIGVVGNLMPRKGQLTAVQAMPEILRAIPGVQLLLVGNRNAAYEQQIRLCAAQEGTSSNLALRDFQPDPENVIPALDACLCVSTKEPFGLTAPEALAAGVPVVATRVGGLPESVLDRQTGLLIRPGRPDELAKAVIELLTDRPLTQRLATAGRQRVLAQFSPAHHYDQVAEILQRVGDPRLAAA